MHRNVGDRGALGAEQMCVFLKIGAKAGGFALVVYGAHQAAFGQSFQTVVHGCQGDAWHPVFDPEKNFDGAGMVGLGHQRFENCFALFGLTNPFF